MRRVENHQLVSTHSRPKAAGWAIAAPAALLWFQLTAARRRLALFFLREQAAKTVSTHSRPKAAGPEAPIHNPSNRRFNSQPPEGGWVKPNKPAAMSREFQLTAARRRLALSKNRPKTQNLFQLTAARRRLATDAGKIGYFTHSFNSQPPEGGWTSFLVVVPHKAGFNSQPPEGGWQKDHETDIFQKSFNSQPPEGGWWYRFSQG